MKKLESNGIIYENIKILDKDILIKETSLPEKQWKKIQSLDLDFIVKPTEVTGNIIKMKYLREYESLSASNQRFNDIEIYKLLSKQLQYIKLLEENKVIHCDMHPNNILVCKKNDDIKLIDFDYSIVDDYIPEDSIFIDDGFSSSEIKRLSLEMDKRDCLGIFFTYLVDGQFPDGLDYASLDKYNMDTSIKKKIDGIINNDGSIEKDDYLTDEIKFLTKIKK